MLGMRMITTIKERLIAFTLATILLTSTFSFFFLVNERNQTTVVESQVLRFAPPNSSNVFYSFTPLLAQPKPLQIPLKNHHKKCNIFDGRWEYDVKAKPPYNVEQCPFLEEKMSCATNGRPDSEYQKWRWVPNGCAIPMINGTDMVDKFRDKRVMLVGDSLNRNMWESLACILYSLIPNASYTAEVHCDGIKTFLKAKEPLNFTIEFFWSPFLIELNQSHESGKKVLVLDKLSQNSKFWPEADIMIFNSGRWWSNSLNSKIWDWFEYKGNLVKKMPIQLAYKRAMKTWAKWVENVVDPSKTTVFFRSISALHYAPQYNQWCYTKTLPMKNNELYKSSYPKSLVRTIERVIEGMKKSKVKYLNITKLSEPRIDAHPSIYRFKGWKVRARTNMLNLTKFLDYSMFS